MAAALSKTLGIFRGTALLMNIVIGAGLLSLPGLAIKQAGALALPAWLLCSAAAFPLLAVFTILGRRFPDAGGVPSYARRAFGVAGQQVATFLFLGAVMFGLPSIALVGGHYLSSLLPGPPHAYAIVILLLAICPHLLPGNGAARAMVWLASLVLVAIFTFLLFGLGGVSLAQMSGLLARHWDFTDLPGIVAPFMMVFFAFTGWEVGAGIAEEFTNPRRDYPAAMLLSFAAATVLYLAIAVVAQTVDLGGNFEAPFVAIVQPSLGSSGVSAVAITAGLVVFANLSGAVWGISRLVFSLARDGLMPKFLVKTRDGRPVRSVIATIGILLAVLCLDWAGTFGMQNMLGLAGQNFLILYAIAAAALISLGGTRLENGTAVLVLAIVAVLLALQGPRLLYPGALIAAALIFTSLNRDKVVHSK